MDDIKNKPGYFRVRISTALLLIAFILFPFALLRIQIPNIPKESFLYACLVQFSFDLLLISFLASFITAVVLAFQRKWWGVVQCIGEMLLCLSTTLFIPVS